MLCEEICSVSQVINLNFQVIPSSFTEKLHLQRSEGVPSWWPCDPQAEEQEQPWHRVLIPPGTAQPQPISLSSKGHCKDPVPGPGQDPVTMVVFHNP